MMQWRNGHFGSLGGKAGELIVYRTTEQKLPIITANDTTTYVITFAELSDTGGFLMYEVPPGPTGGGINDLWRRPVSDTGMVGPDRGKGGKFLIVLAGTMVPENHWADFVITSKTDTILIDTRVLTPDSMEGQRILNAHKIHGLGKESAIRVFEAPNRNWEGHQPRGLDYWKVVHQTIQLNPLEERDMEINARTAYTYEAITVTETSTKNIVAAGIQYLASYKGDAGRWLDGASSRPIIHPTR
jgi:hypothetical protein